MSIIFNPESMIAGSIDSISLESFFKSIPIPEAHELLVNYQVPFFFILVT